MIAGEVPGRAAGSRPVGVPAGQGADVGVAAGADGGVTLSGAGAATGGEGVGDEFRAGPGGQWRADAGRVFQDLVVGEADDGELGGRSGMPVSCCTTRAGRRFAFSALPGATRQ